MLKTGLATGGLVLWMFVAFSLGGLASEQMATLPAPPVPPEAVFPRLLAMVALHTLVLAWLVRRSGWHGWRLVALVFLELFGIQTFMSQIEAAWFNEAFHFTNQQFAALVTMGLLTAALFAPVGVVALRRWRVGSAAPGLMLHINAPRVALLAVLYAAVYFVFGYFVAWQSEDVRRFYSGSAELQPFLVHMRQQFSDSAALPLFQLLRGVFWIGLAVPVIAAVRVSRVEAGLLVGMLFAVLMNAAHLLPNPFMPPAIQMVHLLETATSNALFGFVAAWVLTGPDARRHAIRLARAIPQAE